MRRKDTPNDPQRRAHIVDATIEVIIERGLNSVTARAVAGRADVPLGSVTYYFDSVRALLLETSRHVIERRSNRLHDWFAESASQDLAHQLARLVYHHLTDARDETVVAYELYALGLRDEDFRLISDASIPVLRQVLSDHVGSEAATRLAAAADGYQLESLFRPEPPPMADIVQVLQATLAAPRDHARDSPAPGRAR